VITEERLAERYTQAEAMDRDVVETLAIAPDGTVAAQSTIAAPRSLPDASQWGTYVHREHRGHSLGLAVKVANLRVVQAAHPHLRQVVTQNAETNAWMIAINEEMGYRPVEASLEMVRRF
jgi:RimJ/RimL family protein N-acetyltransferase